MSYIEEICILSCLDRYPTQKATPSMTDREKRVGAKNMLEKLACHYEEIWQCL